MSLRSDFEEQKGRFLTIKLHRESVRKHLDELEKKRLDSVKRMEICSKAIEFVEQVSTEERKGIKKQVEELITSCLHDVFDDSYSVEFDYGMKRSKTSVEVYCTIQCEDGLKVKRQIDGIGGGVADSISLPLKLMVLLNEHRLDRILIVDEPGKHLSVNHVPKFAKFLQNVSHKLGVQIIMSSHHANMDKYADCVNEIHLEGSKSIIERVK